MGLDPHPNIIPRLHQHLHRQIHPTNTEEPPAPAQCQRGLGHLLMGHRHEDAKQHFLQASNRRSPPRPSHPCRHSCTTRPQEDQIRQEQRQKIQGQGQIQTETAPMATTTKIPAIPVTTLHRPSLHPCQYLTLHTPTDHHHNPPHNHTSTARATPRDPRANTTNPTPNHRTNRDSTAVGRQHTS